jgi:mono/diheme cytochrome c family protein
MRAVVGLRRVIGVALAGASLLVGSGCGLAEDEPDLVAGKEQFNEKCGACHILKRAGTSGTQGPNLDEAFRQALADGMERSGIEGAVEAQIDTPARLSERDPVYMPADLVTGKDLKNVSAYVAEVVARPGEDQGRLADAGKPKVSNKPIAAKAGVLEIPAAVSGLAYTSNAATAQPGSLTIKSPNPATVPHNIALEGGGVNEIGPVVEKDGVSEIKVSVKAGTYTFFCSVEGHREGGMEGQLTVK